MLMGTHLAGFGAHIQGGGYTWTDLLAESNIALALRADTGVLDAGDAAAEDGEAIKTWQDQTSNNNHMVQATVSKQPIYKVAPAGIFGGSDAIQFDGADDIMAIGGSVLSGDAGAVFALVRLTSVPNSQLCAVSYGADGTNYLQCLVRQNTASPEMRIGVDDGGGQDTVEGSTSTAVDTNYVMFWGSQGTGNPYIFRVDGSAETTNLVGGVDDGNWMDDPSGTKTLTVGARVRSSEDWHMPGYLGIVVVMDGAYPTAQQITDIESVLTTYSTGGSID